MPALESRNDSESRNASSSSMMCTRSLPPIAQLLRGCRLQGKAERCPATGILIGPDPSAMRLDDGPRYRQVGPHPVRLGSNERLEQLFDNFGRTTWTGIGNAHQCVAVSPGSGCNDQIPTRRVLHGLDSVAHQIEKHLLDLNLVGKDEINHRIELKTHTDAVLFHL